MPSCPLLRPEPPNSGFSCMCYAVCNSASSFCRCVCSALTLLVTRVCADHHDAAVTANHTAVLADSLYAWTDLHGFPFTCNGM